MQEARSRTITWSFAATLIAIGGFAAAVGVLLGWWQAEAYRASEIFGREQVESRVLAGTAHWTGTVVLILGILAALAALGGLVITSADVRRVVILVALAGGVLVVGAAALGSVQSTGVAEAQVGGAGLGVNAAVSSGLLLSALGGLVAAIGGFLGRGIVET